MLFKGRYQPNNIFPPRVIFADVKTDRFPRGPRVISLNATPASEKDAFSWSLMRNTVMWWKSVMGRLSSRKTSENLPAAEKLVHFTSVGVEKQASPTENPARPLARPHTVRRPTPRCQTIIRVAEHMDRLGVGTERCRFIAKVFQEWLDKGIV